MGLPKIIQGGMGVGVSNWRLARAVSREGQLGVVSGTALDQVLARRLQDGDPGGHMRRALNRFPNPEIAERIWRAFYIPGGRAAGDPYRRLPAPAKDASQEAIELSIVSNFVEVSLARGGHNNPIGINYLEKIQIPHLPSIYGAMLAGVDTVLMGAGIPLRIPGVLDRLARQEAAEYPMTVAGAQPGDDTTLRFDPKDFPSGEPGELKRPRFLAIIAANTLALTMLKKANGRVDGFIVEGPDAGGHNAPPRGKLQLNDAGEPVYGERDQVDLAKMRELGVPFWLAGGYGSPERLKQALEAGAAGIQVGTAFAFCTESGLRSDYRLQSPSRIAGGEAEIFTDPLASPTGFPFKVVALEGTLSEEGAYQARPRVCDLGYLREAYRTEAGEIGYRCAGEPVTVYESKGGHAEDAVGRKCLCNGLMANIGYQQIRNGRRVEQGLLTAGDDLKNVVRFLPAEGLEYSAAEVIAGIMVRAPQNTGMAV
jgi:nitronate monooxygenase